MNPAIQQIPSPLGPINLAADNQGRLVYLAFARPGGGIWLPRDLRGEPRDLAQDPSLLEPVRQQLAAYFRKELRVFDLPLNLRGTPFQLKVWAQLQRIPYGTTISYGELARRLGDLKLARAVGAANGANPISIVVPCHRVIGANGSLVGFGGGLDTKRALLELEQGPVMKAETRPLFSI